jgi:hypothetical protein
LRGTDPLKGFSTSNGRLLFGGAASLKARFFDTWLGGRVTRLGEISSFGILRPKLVIKLRDLHTHYKILLCLNKNTFGRKIILSRSSIVVIFEAFLAIFKKAIWSHCLEDHF